MPCSLASEVEFFTSDSSLSIYIYSRSKLCKKQNHKYSWANGRVKEGWKPCTIKHKSYSRFSYDYQLILGYVIQNETPWTPSQRNCPEISSKNCRTSSPGCVFHFARRLDLLRPWLMRSWSYQQLVDNPKLLLIDYHWVTKDLVDCWFLWQTVRLKTSLL